MTLLEIPVSDELFEVLTRHANASGARATELAQHLLESGIESLELPGEAAELTRGE